MTLLYVTDSRIYAEIGKFLSLHKHNYLKLIAASLNGPFNAHSDETHSATDSTMWKLETVSLF